MTDEPHRKTSPHWWIFSEQSNEGKSSGYNITTLDITITAKLSWDSVLTNQTRDNKIIINFLFDSGAEFYRGLPNR